MSVLQPEVPAGDRSWRDTQRAPRNPSSPTARGQHHLPGRRALPAWSHTGCVWLPSGASSLSGLLTALPCVTHPSDSPPLPWRLLRAFQLRAVRSIAVSTFYSPLKKQFCSGSQTSRMTKTNFTRTLSLYLMHVCVHLYTLSQAHMHLCWGYTRNTSLGHNTHTRCPE